MNHDNSADVQNQLPACYRCHASKVRCRRTPGQVRCQRCARAAYSGCHPRPSRRGRIGQQPTRRPSATLPTPKEVEAGSLRAGSSNMPAEPGHELDEPRYEDVDETDSLLDLFAVPVGAGGDGLPDLLWTPLVSHFDPDSVYGGPRALTTTTTPRQPSASSNAMGGSLSEPLPGSVTTASSASSSGNKARDARRGVGGGSERWESGHDSGVESSRLSSASYMQTLTDLNAQMLSQQDGMLLCIRPFPAAPTRHSRGRPATATATATGERSAGRNSPSSDTAMCEGPIEAALRLGLALRSLVRPHQAGERDMPTALFLLSTVLRLVSLLHDLLARLQAILARETDKNALCAWVFPPVRLGSLLLDERFDDRLRPLQMHSIAMALSTAEGLIDEVIQLTETSLPDHVTDACGAMDDGDAKDDFGLQALTRALVARQEAAVESISALRHMLCCS